jgi:hypothetical protein
MECESPYKNILAQIQYGKPKIRKSKLSLLSINIFIIFHTKHINVAVML